MTNHLFITIIFLILAANMQVRSAPQSFTGKIKICVQAEKTFQRGMCVCVCESEKALAADMVKGPGQAAATKGSFYLTIYCMYKSPEKLFYLDKIKLV